MFLSVLDSNMFYFSHEYDLTRSSAENAKDSFAWGGVEYTREQYCFNTVYSEQLLRLKLSEWIAPFICGYVHQTEVVQLGNKSMTLIIISRKDKSRSGTRYLSRGTDAEGNASNFVETEQILTFTTDRTCELVGYVQARGSIPLVWTQSPSFRLYPRLLIDNSSTTNKRSFDNHIMKMKEAYTQSHLINLIDMKGCQKTIGDRFSSIIEHNKDENVRYTWFDFHDECKGMKYGNLSRLIEKIQESVEDFGYSKVRISTGVMLLSILRQPQAITMSLLIE